MPIRTVLVCNVQVPFVHGGAEMLVEELASHLREHDYQAELVTVPFCCSKEQVLSHAAAWRLLDLSSSNFQNIDLVIGTKFPSYFVRHPNKVTWLIHQHRAAYDLCGTVYSEFRHTEVDVALRERLWHLDRQMLGESKRLFTISRNTAARVTQFNGLEAEALYPPPRLAPRLHPGPYGDYVVTVTRFEINKRPDLPVRAMAHVDSPIRLAVVGDGSRRQETERLAEDLGVGHRVDFLGSIDDDALIRLYAEALAVVYTPYDEDYGYVTLEAFLSRKPVVTATDSGGTLEFVQDGTNGLVVPPEPESLAVAINQLAGDRQRAAALGDAGFDRARLVTWDGVIEKLVGE